jgi:tetratricopeptide (TPR) repeat protein
MNQLPKQIIAISASFFILVMIFYGSYLPYKKSKTFISSLNTLSRTQIQNFEQFDKIVSSSLKINAPFGQEELIRQFLGIFPQFIIQNENPQVIDTLIKYIETQASPILDRGRGLSFNQDLYLATRLYLTAYEKTQDKKYLDQAKKYAELSYSLGPKRPQALYSLFNIYLLENNIEKAKEIGEKILTYWPEEESIRKEYENLLKILAN